jgi:hypothetical protein
MTAVDVLGRVDELTDGTGGSVDAVMGAAVGPYRKSRIRANWRTPMRSLLLATTLLLTGLATAAYGNIVGFSFSGTWGGTLGPITAGDTISGSVTWNDTSTTNICPGNPAYTICRGLLSLTLTEVPNTDGLSITSPTDPNVLFAGALYVGASGNVFDGIQINDRSTSCTTLTGTCFGTFFIGPSSAAFSDFQFDSFILTNSYTSSGPSPVPEPPSWLLLATAAGAVLLRFRGRNFSDKSRRPSFPI